MNKVSYVLAKRFSQDPLETCFCKQHPPGVWKNNLPLYDFGYANKFQNQIAFKPILTGSVRDKNTNFQSNRTSSLPEKKSETKQSLRSLKVSRNHK